MASLESRLDKLVRRENPAGPHVLTPVERHRLWVNVSLNVLLDNFFSGEWPSNSDDLLTATWNCGASLLRNCATLHDDFGEVEHAQRCRERAKQLDAELPEWADASRCCFPDDIKRFETWPEKLAWVVLHGSPYLSEAHRQQSHVTWHHDPRAATRAAP